MGDAPEKRQKELTSIEDFITLFCIIFSMIFLLNNSSYGLFICALAALFFSGITYVSLWRKSKEAMRATKTIFIFVFSLLSTVSDNVANFAKQVFSTLYQLFYLTINPSGGLKPATEPPQPINMFSGVNLYLFETIGIIVLIYYSYRFIKYALTIEDDTEPIGFRNWLKAN